MSATHKQEEENMTTTSQTESKTVDERPIRSAEMSDMSTESSTNDEERTLKQDEQIELYMKGKVLHEKGRNSAALEVFLKCLSRVTENSNFPYLPQCLRYVADIFYSMEEYEKAIQFIQAEKLYYETALIDTKDIQRKMEDKMAEDPSGHSIEKNETELMHADEYEGLARMCLDNKQPQMALEYQGKATKLRQQYLGDEHEITRKSLDFFTVLYGEVGRSMYSESFQKMTNEKPNINNDNDAKAELRKRTNCEDAEGTEKIKTEKKEKNRHTLPSNTDQNDKDSRDERIAHLLLLVLFFICLVVLIASLVYIYCKIDLGYTTCKSLKSEVYHYFMKFYFHLHSFTVLPPDE